MKGHVNAGLTRGPLFIDLEGGASNSSAGDPASGPKTFQKKAK